MSDASDTGSAARSDRATHERATVAEALRESARAIAELTQYVNYFVAAKIDQLKLSVQSLVLYAVLGVLGTAAAATALVMAVVLFFIGAAQGIGYALGGENRIWLGYLIVGIAVLGAVAISLGVLLQKLKTASRRRTMRSYEDRLRQQREQFGRDLGQRQGH